MSCPPSQLFLSGLIIWLLLKESVSSLTLPWPWGCTPWGQEAIASCAAAVLAASSLGLDHLTPARLLSSFAELHPLSQSPLQTLQYHLMENSKWTHKELQKHRENSASCITYITTILHKRVLWSYISEVWVSIMIQHISYGEKIPTPKPFRKLHHKRCPLAISHPNAKLDDEVSQRWGHSELVMTSSVSNLFGQSQVWPSIQLSKDL